MKLISLSFGILLTLLINAQESDLNLYPKFNKLELIDGLTNLNVSSIVQDDLGYIWIGTARGLNRFDGTDFKHYLYSEKENPLCHNWVYKLHTNSDGKIFCSTKYGLNLFNPAKNKMQQISSSDEFFFDFIEFENETYGTSKLMGLSLYNKEKNVFEKLANIANDNLLDNLISDSLTGIWAVSNNNLLSGSSASKEYSQTDKSKLPPPSLLVNYNPQTNIFKNYPIPIKGRSISIENIVIIDNILLISGANFSAFNINTSTFIPLPKKWSNLGNLKDQEIAFITRIDKQVLWIGTRTNGLYIFNLKTNTLVNLNKSNSDLEATWTTCAFKDRDKNIWLGTFDRGVQINLKDRVNLNFDNTLNRLTTGKFITSITSDLNHNYIISTRYNGYYIYNSKSKIYKNLNIGNSFLTTNHIRTTLVDSKNKLWIASEKVLHITNLESNKSNDVILPLPNFGIVSLCEHEDNILGCSDAQGFFIFDIEGHLIKQVIELGSNISQIIPYDKNKVIIATIDHGIFIYNINSGVYHKIFKSNVSEASNLNQPITLHLDKDQNLWIGNYVSGLYMLNLKTNCFKAFTTEDGLANNDVVGIIEDDEGYLWLSTSYGLSRFDKKQEFVNFFLNEGLENLQFHAKAAYIDPSGNIYFGGNIGLSYFNSKTLSNPEKKSPPKIILKSLNVQNKLIIPGDKTNILSNILEYTDEIHLNNKQNFLTIEYHAFDYLASKEIRYAYLLEGLDDDWNKVGKRTYANFSNLKPGNYEFKVKAQSNKGLWSNVSSVRIKITPSPFLTVWAFLIYISFLFGIIYISFHLVFRAKLYRNKLAIEQKERFIESEIAKMKIRFFTNISHEIRTPLTLIKGNVDLLSKEIEATNNKHVAIKGIQYSTNRLLDLVNQLLSLRKLENDALDLQVKKKDIIEQTHNLIQPHTYVALSRNISINVVSEFKELYIPLDTDKYEKIVSNLLSNSLKHSKKDGKISINIEMLGQAEASHYFSNLKNLATEAYVKISVIDNGTGIAESDLPNIFVRYKQSKSEKKASDYSGTGIGLNFAKRLVELHKGAITVRSTENIETCFSFVLPVEERAYPKENWIIEETELEKVSLNTFNIKSNESVLKNASKEKDLILIIEDDITLNQFIKTSLTEKFKVITSYDGEKGLWLARNYMPQLILSDIMLPKMDGLELCKQIHEDELISHIPIVLLTAKIDIESKIKGYKYGADDYISKPFEIDLLIIRLQNLIKQRKKLQGFFKRGIITDQTEKIRNPFELNFIKHIELILAEEFHSFELNVNYLADKMSMSRASFFRKFMSILGTSPKDFITKYRINKSIELMKNGNDNLAEISVLCGFSSQSAFSTVFKKEKGITPMQFKQSM